MSSKLSRGGSRRNRAWIDGWKPLRARRRSRSPALDLDMLVWGRYYLAEHFAHPFSRMHRWLADQLSRLRLERGLKINLVGPRGSAKSTLATLAFVLRQAVEEREPYIWIASDTRHQACAHLENIKLELGENGRLLGDYPIRAPGARSRAASI